MANDVWILMPVFDECSTVQLAIRDAIDTELRVALREPIVADVGSTDGHARARVLRTPVRCRVM